MIFWGKRLKWAADKKSFYKIKHRKILRVHNKKQGEKQNEGNSTRFDR